MEIFVMAATRQHAYHHRSHIPEFVFSSKMLCALTDIGIISLGLLSSFFCHERKLLSIMSLPFI